MIRVSLSRPATLQDDQFALRPGWHDVDMTSKDSSGKLHHYVPRGYLRGFATEKERITVLPLDSGRQPYTPSVKNVAAQTHFYRVEELDEPGSFETALSSIEGEGLAIIRRVIQGEFPLPEVDRWKLSYYAALQHVRGPDTRRTIEHLQASMVRLEMGAGGRPHAKSWIKRNLGFEATDQEANRLWDQATQPGGPPIRFSNLKHIQHLLNTAEQITPYLAARPWSLIRFKTRSLITSDAPVSLVRNLSDDAWQGVGFATAWGITFPLTRKIGLLMSDPMVMVEQYDIDDPRVQEMRAAILRGDADRIQAGTAAMEKLFNEHTAEHAREYLYHHPDDGSYVPKNLHEPTLINAKVGGIADADFDGQPWFGKKSPERHE